jgi:hypothetical protein
VVYAFVLLGGTSLLMLAQPRLLHWFILPVLVCGVILGKDAVDWVTGRKDPFDPKAIIGILGLHLFVLAPMLVVVFDYEYDAMSTPPDWRPWLGAMALLNMLGLVGYQFAASSWPRKPKGRSRTWVINERRAFAVLIPALVISGLAQGYLWVKYGGVIGQIAGTRGEDAVGGRFKYQLLANAFPILLLIALTTLRGQRDRMKGKYSVAFFVLVAVFVMYFVVDGLRGSRSSIVWTLFWAAGVIHFFWRRLSAKLLILGLVPLMAFMYVYGFYKSYRGEFLREYEQSSSLSELSERTGRTFDRMLIADLSRSDIQAFLVYRLYADDSVYSLRYGTTYLHAIPRSLLPGSLRGGQRGPPAKTVAGTELQYNTKSSLYLSSKVYGLAGEAMLNFHIYGVLPAFLVFGLFVGWYRRQLRSWDLYDARFFLAPLAANWFIAALIGDFDNLLTFSIAKALFPLVVILLMVQRKPREARSVQHPTSSKSR